jgi:small subunit ribosomal protein S1
VTDKFSVGQVVKGTLEKKENFGYFFSLAPGITGLLPKSKFSEAEKPGLIEQLNVGDSFSVTVAEIHPADRKIVLGPGNAKDNGTWKNYTEDAPPEPMSDLAEKMRQAMESKNDK